MTQAGDVFELPLFPLHTVLFPHMPMPLRIFEPRYRQMLQDCMEGTKSFGIILIRAGSEVGEPAEPHGVGTVASITDVQPQPDGTVAVMIEGTRRFHLLEVTQKRPYQVGLVEYLGDSGDPPSEALVAAVQDVASRCMRLGLAMTGEWVRRPQLPDEPERLSYILAARLSRGPRTKQRLLEARSTAQRLAQLQPLFEEEEKGLRRQIDDRQWFTSTNLN